MPTSLHFTKMQGAGNDYIYVDASRYNVLKPAELSVLLSAYHTGIGSDGLILIGRAGGDADFTMRIFNNDGSEAMMCGNGVRCVGKYVYDKGLTQKRELKIDTLSGIKTLRLHTGSDGSVGSVTVDMGVPQLMPVDRGDGHPREMLEETVTAGGHTFSGTAISMGNPHMVIFTDAVEGIDLAALGPELERHPWFPDRVNVEFAQVLDDGRIRMRVWERGSGITMACGTGACATAAAALLTRRSHGESEVIMDGGTLTLQWGGASAHLFMTGPAETVFDGMVEVGSEYATEAGQTATD